MKWTDEKIDTLVRMYRAGERRRTMMVALGASYKAIDSRIWLLQREGVLTGEPVEAWWIADDIKIGFLDIETSNLKANAGEMLCWAIKVKGEEQIRYDLITQKEMQDRSYDRRIVGSLIEAMQDLDAVVTYWGKRFDAPFARTRAVMLGLPFPKYGDLWHWDAFFQARKLFLPHRKSLDAMTTMAGIEGKTHLDMQIWFHARHGHRAELEYVMEHNLYDVLILEEFFQVLEPYAKWTRTSI